VQANKHLVLNERLTVLPKVLPNRLSPEQLAQMPLEAIADAIRKASAEKLARHRESS
jgi:hypothetical protein